MNKLLLKSILLILTFIFSHSLLAQIDSTKTSLYLKCANEILIHYPKDIDTTKITFEVKGGDIYQLISKKKIVVVPSSSTLSLDVFYNEKLFSSRKYTIRFVGKPDFIIITDKTDKKKFPRKLRAEIVASDSSFIRNCPLDSHYKISYWVSLSNGKGFRMSNIFTNEKTEIDDKTWLEIKKAVEKEPNADWKIIIEEGGAARQNYKGEWEYGGCGFMRSYHYTLESFEE
ncbi:hypothetical protein ACE193_20360 [Bernardetia sp. OM2101]|uniref:hypothetical protein n=1 Tax=Bernardetia sp. OM2101 TaxID=3344876 RepID=UPI0035D0553A